MRDNKTGRPAARESAPASVKTDGKNEQKGNAKKMSSDLKKAPKRKAYVPWASECACLRILVVSALILVTVSARSVCSSVAGVRSAWAGPCCGDGGPREGCGDGGDDGGGGGCCCCYCSGGAGAVKGAHKGPGAAEE